MSENISATTDTAQTTEEQVVVEARVNKKTLQVAAIASAAGAAVAGVACFMARRNNEPTTVILPVEVVPDNETTQD